MSDLMSKASDSTVTPDGELSVIYNGGIAEGHELTLDRYVQSLAGWRDFFVFAAELYFRSNSELRTKRRDELFHIRIAAQREGSFDVVLEFFLSAVAGGIIGGRADAIFIALLKWYRSLISNHLRTKQRSQNIDEIVAALESMSRDENVELVPAAVSQDESTLSPDDDIDSREDLNRDARTSLRTLVDKIDTALRHSASPIGADCNSIDVKDAKNTVIVASFGAVEKTVLDSALTLPLPEGVWTPITVRFERINRKTGRALIYIDHDGTRSDSANYARIYDPAYSAPGNVYAQAFTDDTQLVVWARQVRGERGRLNLMWQISHKPPAQFAMFGPDGSRA